jgi:acetylornithine deacetylase/succinyl-diaminopimelate desuccinylase-like protein
MVFVPSQGGISHAPEEYSSLDSVCLGIQVLAQSVLRLAES